MRLVNQDPRPMEGCNFDPDGARAPWFFYADAALDGTTGPWSRAPLGSMYMRITASNVRMYWKIALNNATADWREVFGAGGTITGDLNLNGGTLTAGDVVIST